jgi:hypothetical protein
MVDEGLPRELPKCRVGPDWVVRDDLLEAWVRQSRKGAFQRKCVERSLASSLPRCQTCFPVRIDLDATEGCADSGWI